MGKSFKKNYKGKARVFSSGPLEEDPEQKRKQAFNKWKEESDESGSDADSQGSEEGEEGAESGSEKGENSSDEVVLPLGNPNRQPTSTKDPDAKPELSRREREEIAKQQAKARYEELHRQGKTNEAKADLARLAIIRKQREDALKKREAEKKAREEASKLGRK
eukprot:Sdes_comp21835_c0_seq1m20390